MPGPPSPNKGYIIPTVFGDLNIWGGELNTNFGVIDTNLGGTATIGIVGSTATVSGTTLQNGGFKFTGSLAVTNTVSFTSYAGFAFLQNNTTGSQNIVCGISGGAAVTVQPGESVPIWSDGVNFFRLAVEGGGIGTTGTGAVVLQNNAALVNPTGVIPPGIMVEYGGAAAPSGWLLCNGAAVSRTTFAALFAICGSSYGNGDGVSTFNVPDMRGRVSAGYDPGNATGRMTGAFAGGASAATIGNGGGEQGHVITGSELTSHNHGVSDPTHAHHLNDPTHNHGYGDPGHTHGVGDPGHAHGVADPGHAHGVADPGHAHTASGNVSAGTVAPTQGFADNSPNSGGTSVASNQFTGIDASGTGIGIFGSGTGVGIFGSGTGIFLGVAGVGIGISGNGTGMTMNGASTGISINGAGASAAHNTIPPVLINNYIIKT